LERRRVCRSWVKDIEDESPEKRDGGGYKKVPKEDVMIEFDFSGPIGEQNEQSIITCLDL